MKTFNKLVLLAVLSLTFFSVSASETSDSDFLKTSISLNQLSLDEQAKIADLIFELDDFISNSNLSAEKKIKYSNLIIFLMKYVPELN